MALEQQGANAASALQAANAKLSKSLRREQETVRESRELDQAKTDFISTVSHELRTPLTSTTGYLEVLCDDAVIDEMGKHAVTGIDRNVSRLLGMVEDLLTMGQIDSNQYVVEPKSMSLLPLIESAIRALQPAADAQNVVLSCAVAPGVPDVLADSGSIDRILINLLSNAVKFSSPNSHVIVSAKEPKSLSHFPGRRRLGSSSVDKTCVRIDDLYRTGVYLHMSSAAELECEVNDIVGVLNSQHAALVDRVVVLLADERLWAGEAMTSMSAWVAWRAGMSPAMARSVVAIAERVDELPASVEAFRRGELSLDQMATIARNAPAWTDVQSRDYAVVMTVTQLRHVLRKYPFPALDDDGREVPDADPDAPESGDTASCDTGPVDTPEGDADAEGDAEKSPDSDAAPSPVEEFLSLWQDDDGSFRLSGRLDADAGMIVQAALNEARDRLFQRGEFGAGLADALLEMAQSSLGSVADPARRSRFRVNLFINTDRDERNMADAAGWNVPDAIRRYLTCNGTVTPVFVDNGLPVSVGRAQYVVPARTRTVIEHRDHGVCRVPGCDATLGLEVHHLIHWEHGGRTDTDNLLLVCGKHHRMHHRGRLDITGNADHPDGLEFRNQHGRIITASGAAPTVPTGPPPKPVAVYAHPDGGRMDTGQIYFNPPRTYYDDLRQRLENDTDYLAKIQPPGLR
jgi:hypothetical protein